MNATPALLELIRHFEGLRLRAYLCPAGVPTIGYGHTGPDVRLGRVISRQVAEELLQRDASRFELAAARLSPVLWFDDQKRAAIASFCFNLGTTRYKSSTLRKRVNAGDWPGAAHQLQKWVWGGGKRLPGLIRRRKAEARLLSG